jgi:hypothetical protein
MGQDISKKTNFQSTGIIHRLFRCFRKSTAVSHLSVLLPVRMEHIVSHFKKFLEIFYCQLSLKFVGMFKCYLKSAEKTDTLREVIPYFNIWPSTVFIIGASVPCDVGAEAEALNIEYSRFYLDYNFLAPSISIIIDCKIIC